VAVDLGIFGPHAEIVLNRPAQHPFCADAAVWKTADFARQTSSENRLPLLS
jgi:hypothetical protein